LGIEDGNLGKFTDDSNDDIPPAAEAAFSSARRIASSSAIRAASSASLVALDFHHPAHDATDVVVGKMGDVDDVVVEVVVAREMAEQTTNDTTEEPFTPLLPIHDDDAAADDVVCIALTDRVTAVTAACRGSKRLIIVVR
jgi:hypothetical protein